MNTRDARAAIIHALAKTAQIEEAVADRYQSSEDDLPFAELDMDSLSALDFCMTLEETLKQPVEPGDLVKHASVDQLAGFLSTPGP
jgi:acyl carrier protein